MEICMTIYDISKEAGVSIATVSRVLNDSANVRPATKTKVLAVIEKYGYSPNAFARGLGLDTMQAVGIICADCSDIFLAKAIYYVEKELRRAGYEGILISSGYEHEGKKEAISILLKKHVDSIILIGSNFLYEDDESNDYIREAAKHIPVMLLNADFDCPNVYCTFCDDFKASYEAAQYMIKKGARSVLHLFDSHSYSGLRKLAGYQAAMLAANVPAERLISRYFGGERESAFEITEFLEGIRDEGIEFDAISASNDYMAMGAIRYARMNGIKVPEELQIIGYNNTVLTTCSYPELSSIDNKVEQISSQLVKTLTDVLLGKSMPQKTVVSGELVIRGTTR